MTETEAMPDHVHRALLMTLALQRWGLGGVRWPCLDQPSCQHRHVQIDIAWVRHSCAAICTDNNRFMRSPRSILGNMLASPARLEFEREFHNRDIDLVVLIAGTLAVFMSAVSIGLGLVYDAQDFVVGILSTLALIGPGIVVPTLVLRRVKDNVRDYHVTYNLRFLLIEIINTQSVLILAFDRLGIPRGSRLQEAVTMNQVLASGGIGGTDMRPIVLHLYKLLSEAISALNDFVEETVSSENIEHSRAFNPAGDLVIYDPGNLLMRVKAINEDIRCDAAMWNCYTAQAYAESIGLDFYFVKVGDGENARNKVKVYVGAKNISAMMGYAQRWPEFDIRVSSVEYARLLKDTVAYVNTILRGVMMRAPHLTGEAPDEEGSS
ncbi:hypothetical protein [Williamsia sterculiae]|uniref:Uncharacterized protein n=1 Tax=Williamsia sterculiae TaxID=1344003 RepID=A0A1N7GFZ4_9NOCA|nr:hypothetical protein [Williamsia sterculiae]SIS11480.1 hypothetical protein SAMN05445060_2738 [Williamsia sterculiae]